MRKLTQEKVTRLQRLYEQHIEPIGSVVNIQLRSIGEIKMTNTLPTNQQIDLQEELKEMGCTVSYRVRKTINHIPKLHITITHNGVSHNEAVELIHKHFPKAYLISGGFAWPGTTTFAEK